MWQIIYISQTFENAKEICDLLERNKILVKLIEKSENNIEILVPSAELSEAQELILAN
jgi:aspartokinase